MSTVLISVFDGDDRAREAVAVLKASERQGALHSNAIATIKRHTDHGVAIEGTEMPLGAKPVVVGLVAGSLVGLLFGPMGAAIGGLIGVTGGISHTAADGDSASAFLDEVARRLGPGTSAVIAELDGGVDRQVSDRLEEMGGKVFWTSRENILNALRSQQEEQILSDERRRRTETS